MPPIKLKYIRDTLIPMLVKSGCKTEGQLQKGIGAFLKQGEEEAIPVVNEDGDPVEISEIILVGAEPAEDVVEEEPVEDEPAEVVQASMNAMAVKAVAAATKASGSNRPRSPSDNKAFKIPPTAKRHTGQLKCFKGTSPTGTDPEYRAYGFGEYIRWLRSKGAHAGSRDWLLKEGHITKAMAEGSNIIGGAFVPEEFSADLIRLVEEFGVFREAARVMPMSRDTMLFPRRTSGLTGAWIGENTTITDSDLGTDNVQLTARKLATLTRISNELMEDSIIGLGDLIATEIALVMATEEDEAGFNGDGTNTNGGIFGLTVKGIDGNHTASVVTDGANDDTFAEVDLAFMHEVTGTLPRFPGINPKWYVHQAAWANVLQRLAAAQGGVTWRETNDGTPTMTFLGFDVVISQVLQSSTGDISDAVWGLFGDISMSSTFGDRKTVEVQTSTERFFDIDQTAIRGIERIDIVNHDMGDNTDAGPIIIMRMGS